MYIHKNTPKGHIEKLLYLCDFSILRPKLNSSGIQNNEKNSNGIRHAEPSWLNSRC
jgi:hypothetical protein